MIGPAELLVGLIILLGAGFVAFCNPPRKVSTLQHAEPVTVTPSNSKSLIAGAAVAVLILAVLFGLAFAAAGAP